jgi:hypothetical protein
MVHSRRSSSCTLFFPRISPQHSNLTDLTTKEQPTTQLDMHYATTQPATQPPNVMPVHDPAHQMSRSLAITELEDGISTCKVDSPVGHRTSYIIPVIDKSEPQHGIALSLLVDHW